MNIHEYVGSLHMHSVFSDGSGEVREIIRFAQESGLDFVMLTDHNTLRAKEEGYEGFYENTALIVGYEINDKENKNHYLAFGVDKTFSTRLPAKEYVKLVKEEGGIGFLAHPHEKRTALKDQPPFPWTEWDTEDFTGIEIWNHMSVWMENLTEENKYQSFIHPLKTVKMPPEETLRLWDELSMTRRVVGIGGVDAHAHKVNLLGMLEVEVFPYKVLFKSIRTHIFTDGKFDYLNKNEFSRFRTAIFESLRTGKTFFANHYLGDAKGFRFLCVSGGNEYLSGAELQMSHPAALYIKIPGSVKSKTRIIRNGVVVFETEEFEAEFAVTEPGAYRTEVVRGNRGWIFSNHIRILK